MRTSHLLETTTLRKGVGSSPRKPGRRVSAKVRTKKKLARFFTTPPPHGSKSSSGGSTQFPRLLKSRSRVATNLSSTLGARAGRSIPTKRTTRKKASTRLSAFRPTAAGASNRGSPMFPTLDAKRRRRRSGLSDSPTKLSQPPAPYSGLLPPPRPEHEGRLTVVLDMDETLIHSEFCAPNEYRQAEDRKKVSRACDFSLALEAEDGSGSETIRVFRRPGLDDFLDEVSKHFECVVFTAALPVYAQPVLDRIDHKGRIVSRLFRGSTVIYKGQPFVKDLAKLGRDMRRIVLVDNNPCAMIARPDNSIPIVSFYDDPDDCELPKILKLLMKLKDLKDVRPHLRKRFRLRQNLRNLIQ